ncbi:lymphokine-activated killer T-cell-originated protein kinase [Contarinia nasturtii]|uniref:lymphokine-activated killer T-cell-originated protein kinase n=1 Tax=Contarinia nasturtii TaxID=265458 RepID=UPI0012D4AE08|nr:lymphokine-activated killer T-cell-originated protein kinase [Contarinia nasturtii]
MEVLSNKEVNPSIQMDKFNTPERCGNNFQNENALSTPLFVPPTPLLKNMGYGTGVHIYRIERSPVVGKIRSPWVVKRLRSKNSDEVISSRLFAEAAILKSLNHPNIVGYRGTKTLNNERVILAMETCDTSLGDLIEQRNELSAGPLEPPKILKVCLDICNALDYLHTEVKLLHGDLKSYNVLIKNSFEQCKLCDFGVSLSLTDDGFVDLDKHPNAHYTGTDIYSAPEVFHAPPQDISSKCDIFSFGLVIFECLTLQCPHYEHLVEDIDGGLEASVLSKKLTNIEPKELFNDSTNCKENQLICASPALKEKTLDESQVEKSIMSIKSTAATVGDDTWQDITSTTFNGTINNTLNDGSFGGNSTDRHPMKDLSATFNSTIDSDMSYNSSWDKRMNDTAETLPDWYGSRPRLPENQQLDEDYFIFCETFFICTHNEPEERPTAGDLLVSLKNVN